MRPRAFTFQGGTDAPASAFWEASPTTRESSPPRSADPSSSSSESARLSGSVSGSVRVPTPTVGAAVVTSWEAMKRASLSFRARSKLYCGGGAARVAGLKRRGRYWGPRGSCLAVPFRPPWSSREKPRTGGAPSYQAGGTLFGSECERGMVLAFELGTGGEGAGVLRPRTWAGRARVSDVVRTSRMGSLRGRVGTRVIGV